MRLCDRQTCADGRRHRFFDQINFRRLRAIRRVFDRAAFDLCDLGWNADDDARADPLFAVVRLANEVLEHLLRHFKVGDDAVLHRADGDDVAGRAPQHLFGFLAHRFDLVSDLVDGDDGRLGDDNAAPLRIDECVCRAQINRQIAGEKTKERFKCHSIFCPYRNKLGRLIAHVLGALGRS